VQRIAQWRIDDILSSIRNQKILATGSILSLVIISFVLIPQFNFQLIGIKRFLQIFPSESSNPSLVNKVIQNPDFRSHEKFLALNSSSVIDIRSNSSLQLTKFTAAAWFKSSQFFFHGQDASPYHFILDKGGLGSEEPGYNMNYGIWVNDLERVQGGFETSSGTDYFVEAKDAKYNDDKWHYVVLTYDDNLLILYVDGVVKDIKVTNDAVPDTATKRPLSIGVNSQELNGFFRGSVDEIRIWNRPLTEQESISQYESGIFDTTGQVLYMPFE
jgi:hypothetical protein